MLAFLVPAHSLAHDLFIVPAIFHVRSGESLRVSFRNGDAFPESEVAPRPVRLSSAQVRSARATAPITDLRIAGNETLGDVVIPVGGDLQVSVETVPNLIELAPDKFAAYLKEEGLTDVLAYRLEHGETSKAGRERYTKFAKSLLTTDTMDGFYKQPLGLQIEIVPLKDPSRLRPGDRLPIQILLRGRPAAGLQVEAARFYRGRSEVSIVGRTDANGKISVVVDRAGKWRLHSIRMERCPDQMVADWQSLWASLTFEIRG